MTDRCEKCGANLALVGRLHHCIQSQVWPAPQEPVKPEDDIGIPITDDAPTERVKHRDYQRKWREANREHYNAYQRDYMRGRRRGE